MAPQEYEQMKRECWEEYTRQCVHEGKSAYGAFCFTFDRAYVLGKQNDAITQEEIVEAAKEYDSEHAYYNSNDVIECFVEGANFALGKQEKEADTVIQGWVARDFDGDVFLYQNEPDRDEIAWNGYMMHSLPVDSFPDLTWESDPLEVEIQIKRKNK